MSYSSSQSSISSVENEEMLTNGVHGNDGDQGPSPQSTDRARQVLWHELPARAAPRDKTRRYEQYPRGRSYSLGALDEVRRLGAERRQVRRRPASYDTALSHYTEHAVGTPSPLSHPASFADSAELELIAAPAMSRADGIIPVVVATSSGSSLYSFSVADLREMIGSAWLVHLAVQSGQRAEVIAAAMQGSLRLRQAIYALITFRMDAMDAAIDVIRVETAPPDVDPVFRILQIPLFSTLLNSGPAYEHPLHHSRYASQYYESETRLRRERCAIRTRGNISLATALDITHLDETESTPKNDHNPRHQRTDLVSYDWQQHRFGRAPNNIITSPIMDGAPPGSDAEDSAVSINEVPARTELLPNFTHGAIRSTTNNIIALPIPSATHTHNTNIPGQPHYLARSPTFSESIAEAAVASLESLNSNLDSANDDVSLSSDSEDALEMPKYHSNGGCMSLNPQSSWEAQQRHITGLMEGPSGTPSRPFPSRRSSVIIPGPPPPPADDFDFILPPSSMPPVGVVYGDDARLAARYIQAAQMSERPADTGHRNDDDWDHMVHSLPPPGVPNIGQHSLATPSTLQQPYRTGKASQSSNIYPRLARGSGFPMHAETHEHAQSIPTDWMQRTSIPVAAPDTADQASTGIPAEASAQGVWYPALIGSTNHQLNTMIPSSAQTFLQHSTPVVKPRHSIPTSPGGTGYPHHHVRHANELNPEAPSFMSRSLVHPGSASVPSPTSAVVLVGQAAEDHRRRTLAERATAAQHDAKNNERRASAARRDYLADGHRQPAYPTLPLLEPTQGLTERLHDSISEQHELHHNQKETDPEREDGDRAGDTNIFDL